MSDTAWFEITFKKTDFKKINAIIKEEKWWDEIIRNNNTIEVTINEANYGGIKITEALEKADIPFHAYYGAGGTYGPGSIVYFKNKSKEVSTDREGMPVIAVHKDGIIEYELKLIKKYYKLVDKLEKYFE